MANKTINQLNPSAQNVQDVDEMEVQLSGETVTKKVTGAQVRAVEKAERQAQDDTIEAACGLQTNGTYLAEANSWGLRSQDFATGCTDRAGATGALDENIQNALRLLDARVYAAGNGTYVVKKSNLTDDDTWTDLVPAGFMLVYAIFEEKAGNTALLDLGTSAGGNQVFINQEVTASSITTVVLQRVFSLTAATTLYLNDDDAGSGWNGATVDVYLVMQSILPGGAPIGNPVVMGYYEYDGAEWCNLPTSAMIEAIVGLATDYPAGSVFVLKDTDGTCPSTLIYFIMTDGSNWQVNSANFSEAT